MRAFVCWYTLRVVRDSRVIRRYQSYFLSHTAYNERRAREVDGRRRNIDATSNTDRH